MTRIHPHILRVYSSLTLVADLLLRNIAKVMEIADNRDKRVVAKINLILCVPLEVESRKWEKFDK